MTNIIDDGYGISLWEGDDWSTGRVREAGTSGSIKVGWNQKNGKDEEVFITVADGFNDANRAFVMLNKETATEVLHHLNTLLGNPLSYPPSAG